MKKRSPATMKKTISWESARRNVTTSMETVQSLNMASTTMMMTTTMAKAAEATTVTTTATTVTATISIDARHGIETSYVGTIATAGLRYRGEQTPPPSWLAIHLLRGRTRKRRRCAGVKGLWERNYRLC